MLKVTVLRMLSFVIEVFVLRASFEAIPLIFAEILSNIVIVKKPQKWDNFVVCVCVCVCVGVCVCVCVCTCLPTYHA